MTDWIRDAAQEIAGQRGGLVAAGIETIIRKHWQQGSTEGIRQAMTACARKALASSDTSDAISRSMETPQ